MLRKCGSSFPVFAGPRDFGFSAFDRAPEFLFCCVVESPGFLLDLVGDLVLGQKLLRDLANFLYPHALLLFFVSDLVRRYCHFVDGIRPGQPYCFRADRVCVRFTVVLTWGSLCDCSVALVPRGDFCGVAVHCELEAPGSAEKALPRKLVASVGEFVVAFPGYSKVGVREVCVFGAGYICSAEHIVERFVGLLDSCATMRNAIAWVRQWTDDEVRQFFVLQVAILVVSWLPLVVFYKKFIANSVYNAFAFLVVGTEIDG